MAEQKNFDSPVRYGDGLRSAPLGYFPTWGLLVARIVHSGALTSKYATRTRPRTRTRNHVKLNDKEANAEGRSVRVSESQREAC